MGNSRMKKLLVAGIALCAGVLASSATIAQTDVAMRYAGEWSGFYVGVRGGEMDFKTSGPFTGTPGETWATNSQRAALGGLHGGFQAQTGNLVWGIEGAWSGTFGDKFGIGDGSTGQGCTFAPGIQCQARISDIIQVGPRVGVAIGQWLIYATGGYAHAEIATRRVDTGTVIFNTGVHHDGWYAGGGVDLLVLRNLAIGVEYLHYDFSSAQHNVAAIPADNANIKADANAVLLRLTIKQ
jgi:opacity protein-like surface antigen